MDGDPINTSTGNKYLQDDDYPGGGWLIFRRFYNSTPAVASTAMGAHWRHSFDRSLEILGTPASSIVLFRPDGKQETFTKANGLWATDPDIPDVLIENDNAQGVATSYTVFVSALRHFETYDTTGLLQTVTDETDVGATLTYSTTLTAPAIAPRPGLLLTVTDPMGRQLNFTYNSNGNVSQMKLPDGESLTYAYDTNSNLLSVQYPDTTTRQYVYNESALTGGANLPNAMTGVVDEAGVRYENTTYDSTGRATSSSFAGSVGTTQITYNSNGTSTVQYPLGRSATMGFTTLNGLIRVASLDQPCGPQCDQPWKTRTYDSNGYPASYTDFNGNITTTTYDGSGLLTQTVEAQSQANQRTTNLTWDSALRNPLTRKVLDTQNNVFEQSGWAYNTRGQPTARCEIDPTVSAAAAYTCAATGTVPAGVRRWTYTYCDAVDGTQCPLIGLLLSATGPRTDLTQTTTYSYYMASSAVNCGTPGSACYQAGDLHTVTDALGHTTTFASYGGAGRVTRITDANGINTDMTYTWRGSLASRTVDGTPTTITYWPYGAVKSITDPDGVVTSFTYDAAHRLTDVTDALGNRIHYTLDAAGNKTGEQTFDTNGTVRRSLSRNFNPLGQLTAVIDGLNRTVLNAGYSDSYDGNGNLVHSADALGVQRQQGFDAFNRLTSTLDNYNGTDTSTQNTQNLSTYGPRANLATRVDPSGLTTTYYYDSFHNRTGAVSPDTNTTNDTYDIAGNRIYHTDARSQTSTSSYDALDRLISTTYSDSTLNVTYAYDEGPAITGCPTPAHPMGRLSRIVEANVTTVFCYGGHGNLVQKMQLSAGHTDTVQASYTGADRLSTLRTPSGSFVLYLRDANGRIANVQLTPAGSGSPTNYAVSTVTYLPFGPVASYTLGNGQTVTRGYDANYALTDLTSPAFNLHVARDAMGDITAIGNAAGANPATETYSYDPLYRLTGITDAGTALESYTYNKTGDRLSKTAPGLATGAYLYTTGTHQLASINGISRANDANGNTTGSVIGGNTYGFGYNGRNRLTVAQLNGATVGTYTYNALGQRIGKVATFPQAVTERYAYNEAGQLIGEYGTTNRDYVWLGDIPVAVIDNTTNGSVTTSVVNYVTADQLGTPRAVTDGTGTVIWQLPYAGNAFEELQPTSSSGYVLNLRSAGEYYDAETGSNSNGYRTREPATGRFLQSDPIGLAGGISTYAAVGNNPLSYTDALGLRDVVVAVWTMDIIGTGSVGHVFVGEMNGDTILSQFPHGPGGKSVPEGPNNTLSWSDTLGEEKRTPDAVYKVNVSDDFGFDYVAKANRDMALWNWHPHEYSGGKTNCTVAAQEAFEDGGVPVPRPSINPLLTPSAFKSGLDALIKGGNPNVTRISHVPWN